MFLSHRQFTAPLAALRTTNRDRRSWTSWTKDRAPDVGNELLREQREFPSLAVGTQKRLVRLIGLGVLAIVLILAIGIYSLLANLPDANAFNQKVEEVFVQSDAIRSTDDIRALEILAQSGTTFAETLKNYRLVISILLLFSAGLLIVLSGFILAVIFLNRRLSKIVKQGIQVSSLKINRDEKTVVINDIRMKLTPAAIETIAVLAEARLDDEYLSGAEIEAFASGRHASDCDEATGTTRVKRLRDTLGNQLMSEVLIKNVARQGYTLDVEKSAIEMV